MKYVWEDAEFWKDTANRAIWTFCESAFGMLTIGQAFTEINWVHLHLSQELRQLRQY